MCLVEWVCGSVVALPGDVGVYTSCEYYPWQETKYFACDSMAFQVYEREREMKRSACTSDFIHEADNATHAYAGHVKKKGAMSY